jgi:hypothetical protein
MRDCTKELGSDRVASSDGRVLAKALGVDGEVEFSLQVSRGLRGHSSSQPFEQRLGLLQIARVEAFGEPAVDRSEKVTSCSSSVASTART